MLDPWIVALVVLFCVVATSSVGSVIRDWYLKRYIPRRNARKHNQRTLEFAREMRQQQQQEQQQAWQRQQEEEEWIPLPPRPYYKRGRQHVDPIGDIHNERASKSTAVTYNHRQAPQIFLISLHHEHLDCALDRGAVRTHSRGHWPRSVSGLPLVVQTARSSQAAARPAADAGLGERTRGGATRPATRSAAAAVSAAAAAGTATAEAATDRTTATII
ncbi:hypothetical protein PG994_001151 [Apiospora phragmitis]|uniref:Uncharacterized protein n=1 Tax=Apiospora phragmitis TaxID=2905665 RepID=A0ABR1WSS7_9PEZI